jgi:GT2 family glycosyltransferase
MAEAVTVLIPVWNGRPLLVRLLEALARQTAPPEEVLVVDNGSTDGASEEAEVRGARVIRLGANLGFARAVNEGLRRVGTPLVAIVNSDVEPAADWLEKLLAALARERVWFVCGRLFRPGGEVLDGAFDLVTRGVLPWRAGSGQRDHPVYATARPIALASMTATLYRRRLFEETGMLEPAFDSYLEDADFALRAAVGGYRGWYEPAARAVHVGSATLGRWHPATVRLLARNQVFLAARHLPPALARRYWRPLLAGQLLWGLVALRHGRPLAWLAGKAEGLRRRREVATLDKRGTEGALRRLLEESESELMRLQAAAGADLFWRCYRRLAGAA